MPKRRHDPDIVECRNCERTFDLARVSYYGALCPVCHPDVNDGEESGWK